MMRSPSALALCFAVLTPLTAQATVPTTVQVRGQLRTPAGGPAADGAYMVTFRLYANVGDPQAVWTSVVAKLGLSNGAFRHALGSLKKLDIKLVASGKTAWLGVQVGNEPELQRTRLGAAPFASRARRAGSLACTGCMSLAALQIDGDLNLGGNAIKAKQVAAGNVLAGTVSAQSLVGDGSKLTGAQPKATGCPKGQVVVGVKSDGTVACQAAAAPGGGLDGITAGLLTTAFAEPSVSKTVPKPIQDNNPIGTVDTIDVGDVGKLTKFSVTVSLTSSDLSGVEVILYDAANQAFVLHKGTPGKVLKETWPITAKTVSGDLNTWIGKNPKGKWRLRIIDSNFLNNGNDGQLLSWSINLLAQSSNQVTSTGRFAAAGGFGVQNKAGPPFACDAKKMGHQYFDTKAQRMYYCDGEWRELLVETLCGNGIINSTENCDDGNNVDGDSCSNACVAEFKAVTFTTCGRSGRLGPSQGQCNNTYGAGNFLQGKVSVSNGIQSVKVPYNGMFRIEAWGAQGGSTGGGAGGKGARMRGDYKLNVGDVLWILVGQAGTGQQSSGGGGGSFVARGASYQQAKPLVVAGGPGWAGGAGSFNGGANKSNSAGVQAGHGKVVIGPG